MMMMMRERTVERGGEGKRKEERRKEEKRRGEDRRGKERKI